jgi:phosphohistidine swiveling domain-containing protein
LYRTDQERIAKLDQKFIEVRDSKLPTIDKIYWLIEDCKRYGTLPFAGLARAGFIAVQLLRSMVDLQIITASEFNRYLKSLNTVSKQLVNDFGSYRKNQKTKQQILDKYGHLRPGTYDILSARYDEAFDVYFSEDSITNNHLEEEGEHFEFSDSHKEKISFHLAQNGIMVSVDELMEFIKEAIEGREYSKFVFTRSLSHVLLLIDQLGSSVGISKEDMSYVDVKTILSLYSSVTSLDLGSILKENIQRNKAEYEVTKAIKLPEIITDPSKIYSFYVGESEPNFVTQNRIVETVILESQLTSADLKDRIVMIRSADPGYDWLFSRNIAGLVTMYGGSNSHMAIRCAELQIPAAIGCGERLFDQLSQSSMIEIDCASRQIRKIN